MDTSLLTRIGAACGVLYVALAILANDVLGAHPPDSTAGMREIGTWWRTHEVGNGTWALAFLELVALLCFPVFVLTLAWLLQRADGGATPLPAVVAGMGLLSAAIKIGSGAPMFALAWRADDGVSDQLAAVLVDMNGAAFILTWALDAVLLAAAGGVILRTSCLPRWLGWFALVTAPLLLANVAVAVSGPPLFLLALIWFVAVGVTVAVRGVRAADPVPVPAA